jgi:Tol biopolymer transport system component
MSLRLSTIIIFITTVSVVAQTLDVVSRGDDSAIGALDSGSSGVFIYQARPVSVNDTGDVVFVTRNSFDGDDDNTLFDVYQRAGSNTGLISAYSDFFNPFIADGHAEVAAFASGQAVGMILRQAAADSSHFADTQREIYLIDAGVETSLALSTQNVNLPIFSADGNAFVFTADGDAIGDGGSGNGVFAALRDDAWTIRRMSVTETGAEAVGDTMRMYDDDLLLQQPQQRYGVPAISNTDTYGLQVVFVSNATNLSGSSSGNPYIYLRQDSGQTTRISNRHVDGQSPNPRPCYSPAISGDGTLVAFVSDDPFIAIDILGDIATHIYLLNRDGTLVDPADGAQSIVDVNAAGDRANDDSELPALNDDGRFVVFQSRATNLDAAVDGQGNQQIYVRDRTAGTTQCLSSVDGTGADADCFAPGISANGRYITFISNATNLGSVNGAFQVYRYDRGSIFLNLPPAARNADVNADLGSTKTIVLSATDADNDPLAFFITDIDGLTAGTLYDGDPGGGLLIAAASDESPYELQGDTVTYVPDDDSAHTGTFAFKAREQGAGFTEFSNTAAITIHVADLAQGIITILSDKFITGAYFASTQFTPPSPTGRVELSNDGQRVVFASKAELDPADSDVAADVFRFDRDSGIAQKTFLVSSNVANTLTTETAALSPDGEFVAFKALAGLIAGDSNSTADIYLTEIGSSVFTPVSLDASDEPRGNSDWPSVSGGGDRVAFIAPDPDSGIDQVYVWSRSTGGVQRASMDVAGDPASADCSEPMISGDGCAVVFLTTATLTADAVNSAVTVYAHVIATGETIAVSRGAAAPDGDANWPSVSFYGSFVAFASRATNLVAGDDVNGDTRDVFLYDLSGDTISRLAQPTTDAAYPRISGDGRFIYYTTGGQSYLFDRRDDSVTQVTIVNDEPGNGSSFRGAVAVGVSGDLGVAFASGSTNLLPGVDDTFHFDVFFSELLTTPNEAPESTSDGLVTTNEDIAATVQLSATDADNSEVYFNVLSLPAHGMLLDDGVAITVDDLPWRVTNRHYRLTFAPAQDYNNTAADRDSFDVQVSDLFGPGDTATIELAVDNVNDDPVLTAIGGQAVNEGETLTVTVAVTDPDVANSANPDVLGFVVEGVGDVVDGVWTFPPSFETVTLQTTPLESNVTITVDDGSGGVDDVTFAVVVHDVNVAPVASNPAAGPANPVTTDDLAPSYDFDDFDADTEGASIVSWYFRTGPVEFALYEGELTGEASVPAASTAKNQQWYFTVEPADDRLDAAFGIGVDATPVTIANSAPQNDTVETVVAEDDSVEIELAANDADGDTLTVTFTEPEHGTVSAVARASAPNLLYTPDPDYYGDDEFTVTVNDGSADSAAATVSVAVTAVEDDPILSIDGRLVLEDGTLQGQITTAMIVIDDPDFLDGLDPAQMSVLLTADPQHGVLTDQDGAVVSVANPVSYTDFPLTYTANDNGFRETTLRFQARDTTARTSDAVALAIISGAQLQDLVLAAGWNLLSFAMDPVDAADVLFVGMIRGETWGWDGQAFTPVTVLAGGSAYWVYAEAPVQIASVPGEPLDGTLLLDAGWHGIGPTGAYGAYGLPEGRLGTVWGWDALGRRFIDVEALQAGDGYFFNSDGTDVTFE